MGNQAFQVMNDFKDFSFKGKKGSEFGITRVSSGNRYNENLNPTLKDTTVNITGRDGTVWFDSTHTQRPFKVDFAFDSLTESQLRNLKVWLNGKDAGELIFDEEPYKAYYAKVTGNATVKYLCFNKNPIERVYKGEGSISFTAYSPYAHMPVNGLSDAEIIDTHYSKYWYNYSNADEWLPELDLPFEHDSQVGYLNQGDLPTPFEMSYCCTLPTGRTYNNLDYVENEVYPAGTQVILRQDVNDKAIITINAPFWGIKWNSETGLIYIKGFEWLNSEHVYIPIDKWILVRYSGSSLYKLDVTDNNSGYKFYLVSLVENEVEDELTEETTIQQSIIEVELDTATMKYNYLFY